MRLIDHVARGRGYAIAQAKVVRRDGSVEYHLSAPQIRRWDLIGWAWYWAHRRDLKRRRSA